MSKVSERLEQLLAGKHCYANVNGREPMATGIDVYLIGDCKPISLRVVWQEVVEIADRLTAAEAEVERLREGIREVSERLRTGTHCRMCEHMQDACDCKEITAEYDILLTPPRQEAGDDE